MTNVFWEGDGLEIDDHKVNNHHGQASVCPFPSQLCNTTVCINIQLVLDYLLMFTLDSDIIKQFIEAEVCNVFGC